MTQITNLNVFPLSVPWDGFGSDPRNPITIYSLAVLEIQTDNPALTGGGGDSFIFTIGQGTCESCALLESTARRFLLHDPKPWSSLEQLATGPTLGNFSRHMLEDSHYNWLGAAGLSRMAIGAVTNALWDLCAKLHQTTGWQFLAEKSPEDLLAFIDFTHIADFLPRDQALDMLHRAQPGKSDRIEALYKTGPAAYNTAGWSAVPDDLLVIKTKDMLQKAWPQIKIKVGAKFPTEGLDAALASDLPRLLKVFDTIRASDKTMKVAVDSNQIFDPATAVEYITRLALALDDAGRKHNADYRLAWFEEPTSPLSALGHLQIKHNMRERLRDLGKEHLAVPIATGEHCPAPIVFKDLLAGVPGILESIDIVQPDYARVGGIGDLLAIILMARKANALICPHAGGIGLCEGVMNVQALNEALFGPQPGAVLEFVEGGLHQGVYQHPASVHNGHYVLPSGPIGNATALTPYAKQTYLLPTGSAWCKPENQSWATRLMNQSGAPHA